MLFFKCIRFSLLDKVYVKDFLGKNLNLLSSNPKCLELIESYLKMLNSDSELYNQKSLLKQLNEKYEFSLNENKRAGMTQAQYCFILIGGNYELDDGFYVNCFNPFGECRKSFNLNKYPQLLLQVRDVGLFAYKGPHELNYLSNYLKLIQNPIARIDTMYDFIKFVINNDVSLIICQYVLYKYNVSYLPLQLLISKYIRLIVN